MSFENEKASYSSLRRILDSDKVKSLVGRLKVNANRKNALEGATFLDPIKDLGLENSTYMPSYIIAIDGSYHQNKVENGYPGAEYGYITTSAVIIDQSLVDQCASLKFIDPKKFRETERLSSIETVIPGFNIVIDQEKSSKSSMRKTLFEELRSISYFKDGETLLDTYEALLKIKLHNSSGSKPKSPIDGVDNDMTYGYGEYVCPYSSETLYSTDALRLHELISLDGSSNEMYGQIMQMFEKLSLIHILRSFERKNWLSVLGRVIFILDGPLACFSTWSWMNKSIQIELQRINKLQKQYTKQDMLIFGIEKSGVFQTHFEALDTKIDGANDKIKNGSIFLITDEYIKKNIIISESDKQYGQDTYFGRKLFYKTKVGYKIVPVLAFLDPIHQNLSSANIDQHPRLADLINVLENIVCSRYPNSVSPLIAANAEASIPLNLGNKIFDRIAEEIRKKG